MNKAVDLKHLQSPLSGLLLGVFTFMLGFAPSTQAASLTWQIERVDAPKYTYVLGNRSIQIDPANHIHAVY